MAEQDHLNEQAHWAIPLYLAAHGSPNSTRPTFEELGLAEVIETATRCADFRGHGRHFTTLMPPKALRDNPWREVFGLAGSIGESLAIAVGCEVEVEHHRRARACGDLPREMIIGQRFFSIAEGQEIISIGHRLANLVLRALATNSAARDVLATAGTILGEWSAAHSPFSDNRAAWISLNKRTVDELGRAVSSSPHPSLRRLVAELKAIQRSPAWRALDETRGQDFHRWRAESSVLAGIDDQSGHVREVIDTDGRVTGYTVRAQSTRYTMADGLEDAEAATARAALIAIGEATTGIINTVEQAAEPLSRGSFVLSGQKLTGWMGGLPWDERNCSCCADAAKKLRD